MVGSRDAALIRRWQGYRLKLRSRSVLAPTDCANGVASPRTILLKSAVGTAGMFFPPWLIPDAPGLLQQ